MATVALSGNDTFKINSRIFADFAADDIATIDFPDDLANLKTGKNGNTIYSLNESGKQAEVVVRLVRGSADDKYLSSLLASMERNFAGFVLMTGEFIKRIGDGAGALISDTYIMSGGVFTKKPGAKANTAGDADQSLVVYTLRFANSPRILE